MVYVHFSDMPTGQGIFSTHIIYKSLLNDAFNVLGEVVDAIDGVQQATQKGDF